MLVVYQPQVASSPIITKWNFEILLYCCCFKKRPCASNPSYRIFIGFITLLFTGIYSLSAHAQSKLNTHSVTKIAGDVTTTLVKKQHSEVGIKIDGLLDEDVWATLPYMDDFCRNRTRYLSPNRIPDRSTVILHRKWLVYRRPQRTTEGVR